MDPTKKELYTAKRSSGLDTSSDPKIAEALQDLKSDLTPTNWILFKISSSNCLQHFLSGAGGFIEFNKSLNDDDIYFGVLRVLISGKSKFYNISYIGDNLSGLKKGKSSMYKSAVFTITDAHGEISPPSSLPEFTEDYILNFISRLSGSTKSLISW